MGNILDLHNVTKIFGKGSTEILAVDNVDLELKKGEIVLIMGPSGSGKTTLLSIAGALLKPTKGKIFLNGEEITNLSERKLPIIRRKRIGFIFQAFNLLENLTALENVEIAMQLAKIKSKEAKSRAKELLLSVGLGERLNHKPSELSGGEKQRVAIARALANNPDIILVDEPTGNLDSKAGHDILMYIFKIAKDKGKAVLIVSHDLRIIDVADRVLWLEDGKLSMRKKDEEPEVRDLVCGMHIKKREAGWVSYYKGIDYYFDSSDCKNKFDKDPEKYIQKSDK